MKTVHLDYPRAKVAYEDKVTHHMPQRIFSEEEAKLVGRSYDLIRELMKPTKTVNVDAKLIDRYEFNGPVWEALAYLDKPLIDLYKGKSKRIDILPYMEENILPQYDLSSILNFDEHAAPIQTYHYDRTIKHYRALQMLTSLFYYALLKENYQQAYRFLTLKIFLSKGLYVEQKIFSYRLLNDILAYIQSHDVDSEQIQALRHELEDIGQIKPYWNNYCSALFYMRDDIVHMSSRPGIDLLYLSQESKLILKDVVPGANAFAKAKVLTHCYQYYLKTSAANPTPVNQPYQLPKIDSDSGMFERQVFFAYTGAKSFQRTIDRAFVEICVMILILDLYEYKKDNGVYPSDLLAPAFSYLHSLSDWEIDYKLKDGQVTIQSFGITYTLDKK
ncbi:MAG: hypothetical protein MK193_08245 [Lentisphaeria bacterium]|nr:hypothetical protein [Lentisphaeria bacterium]